MKELPTRTKNKVQFLIDEVIETVQEIALTQTRDYEKFPLDRDVYKYVLREVKKGLK